ncbi:mechanosensitive ion channel family protein [Opitutaceae bacterium]
MLVAVAAGVAAQEAVPVGATEASANTTAAAAAVATGQAEAYVPDFLEHLVDALLALFDVRGSGNTWQHYGIAAFIFVGSFLLRKIGATLVFSFFKKLASRTRTTLDDKLLPALEDPIKAIIALLGAYAAIKVLKLTPQTDTVLAYSATVAFSCAIFWLFLRAFNTVLDHAHDLAKERQLGVAAFMPWIKKTLVVMFVVFGVLMIAQSLGANVRAFLAGLGIGGLAFALAAQDTIANLFGSVVVAIDQPFKIGETVQIGSHLGLVEDIGLRSTKLRTAAKSLITIPNKTVASEAIANLSRFTQRRVEQVIGLTYDTPAGQMDAVVAEFKEIILSQPEVDPASVMVYFRDYSASSLDIWVVYLTKDPDFQAHMRLRQRINLAMMRAVQARGLSFAFPSQTLYLDGDVAKRLAGYGNPSKPVT